MASLVGCSQAKYEACADPHNIFTHERSQEGSKSVSNYTSLLVPLFYIIPEGINRALILASRPAYRKLERTDTTAVRGQFFGKAIENTASLLVHGTETLILSSFTNADPGKLSIAKGIANMIILMGSKTRLNPQ